MPKIAAVIATLITERPPRIACIAEKSALTPDEMDGYLRRIQRVVELHRGIDRCRACGTTAQVLALFRNERPPS